MKPDEEYRKALSTALTKAIMETSLDAETRVIAVRSGEVIDAGKSSTRQGATRTRMTQADNPKGMTQANGLGLAAPRLISTWVDGARLGITDCAGIGLGF
jgi:hypothetical protein